MWFSENDIDNDMMLMCLIAPRGFTTAECVWDFRFSDFILFAFKFLLLETQLLFHWVKLPPFAYTSYVGEKTRAAYLLFANATKSHIAHHWTISIHKMHIYLWNLHLLKIPLFWISCIVHAVFFVIIISTVSFRCSSCTHTVRMSVYCAMLALFEGTYIPKCNQ